MATRDDSSDNDGEGETTKRLQRGFTTGDEVRKPVGVFVCLFTTSLDKTFSCSVGLVCLCVTKINDRVRIGSDDNVVRYYSRLGNFYRLPVDNRQG